MTRLGRWLYSLISCTVTASPDLISGSLDLFHPLPPLGHTTFLLFFSHFVLLFGPLPFSVLSESHLNLGAFAKLSGLLIPCVASEISPKPSLPLFGLSVRAQDELFQDSALCQDEYALRVFPNLERSFHSANSRVNERSVSTRM